MGSVVHTGCLPRVAWKNGAGTTRDVALRSNPDDVADIWWRLSIADLSGDTPFSPFPGFERHFLVATPGAVAINVDGLNRTARYGHPQSFSGDSHVAGRLITGPATAINLFTRRGSFAGAIEVHNVHGQHSPHPEDVAMVLLTGSATTSCTQQLNVLDAYVFGPESPQLVFENASVAIVRVWP